VIGVWILVVVLASLAVGVWRAWSLADLAFWTAHRAQKALEASSVEREALAASWQIHQEATEAFAKMLTEARAAQGAAGGRGELS
jgi:hypothetical protein